MSQKDLFILSSPTMLLLSGICISTKDSISSQLTFFSQASCFPLSMFCYFCQSHTSIHLLPSTSALHPIHTSVTTSCHPLPSTQSIPSSPLAAILTSAQHPIHTSITSSCHPHLCPASNPYLCHQQLPSFAGGVFASRPSSHLHLSPPEAGVVFQPILWAPSAFSTRPLLWCSQTEQVFKWQSL